jgi:tRNA pseudouridine38-40 synthase
VRVRLTVAYDGSGFHGFAINDGVRSVAGELTDTIATVVGAPVSLVCAGRTDKGVHAVGQVVSLDLPSGADLGRLERSVNAMLGPEIAVRDIVATAPDFDARRMATARTYRYTILNRSVPDPFMARTSWLVPAPLELRSMILACDPLIGEQDFSAFCRRQKPVGPGLGRPSLVREVLSCRWDRRGDDVLSFEIRATSFCQQMVRALVGTLVDVGAGRRRAGEMTGILASRDRHRAASLAPPQGLCLWRVDY